MEMNFSLECETFSDVLRHAKMSSHSTLEYFVNLYRRETTCYSTTIIIIG